MRVGIDVNGVLRNTIGKITQVYQKFYVDGYSNDFNDEISIIEGEPFKYEMMLPVTSLTLSNHFKFKNEEEYYSFLYEEHPMEIFGHSPSTEMTTFIDLNSIYVNYRRNNDFIVISDEIGKSKPATLFFLSKFGCEIEKIIFFNNVTINSIWNEFDILLTSNPILLLDSPSDKTVVKFETDYNKHIEIPLTITKMKEFDEILKKLNVC